MQVKSKKVSFAQNNVTPYPDTGACPVPRYGGGHDPLRPPRACRRSTLVNGGRCGRNGRRQKRGQIWQERPSKLDRPSLSFGSGAVVAEVAEVAGKIKKLFEELRPKSNFTPHSDDGPGTILYGQPDAHQRYITTKTPHPYAFPTTHEAMFLNQGITDSAISRPISAISFTPSKLDRRPISFGPVPKVPFQTKTFPTAPECLSPSSVPARPDPLTPCGLTGQLLI